MIELNKETYEEHVTKGSTPIIVDFWASWCGPCQALGPVYEKVSKEYEGKLTFAKLNTEEFGDIAQDLAIRGIPCMIVFNNGKEVDRIIGFKQEDALKEEIDKALAKI